MKHNLPWNVTGIPPEAREVVRAAAHREGITVGEWLTRRILSEQTDTQDARESEEEALETRSRPPREAEPRRPREDFAPQYRADEAGDLFQRIDETLRHLARRLDDGERLQREAQHAMSVAANEINAATRDQAQAFQHLTARIEKAERQSDTSALRDAIRTLHQGLSRLADQIAKTATDSTSQITALSANVDTLAGNVVAARDESDRVAQLFEEKLAALAERVKQSEDEGTALVQDFSLRLKQVEERFDERLNETERRVSSNSNLDETVTKLESRMFAAEQRLEESVGRHLAGLERTLGDINSRLVRTEQRDQDNGQMHEALRNLNARIASAEKTTQDSLTGIESNLADTVKRIAAMEAAIPSAAPAIGEAYSGIQSEPELPPFAETPVWVTPRGAEPASNTKPAIPETNPQPLPFSPLADAYLAKARLAGRVAGESGDDPFRRGRHQNGMARDDAAPTPKESGRSRAMAAAAVILVSLALGYSAVRFQASRTAANSETPQLAAAQTDVAAQQDASPAGRSNAAQTALASAPAAQKSADVPAPQTAGNATPVKVAQPAETDGLTLLTAQANSGDMKAATTLGLKYADGDGVAIDETEAARWLTKAASAGEAVAAYRLGALYERGRGVKLDAKQAMRWYIEAAKQGNRRAMHNLAVGYADGAGGEKNFAEAARWFKAAAELGLTDSQFNIAVLYERGLGVKQSLSEAYKWYQIAAGSGDAESKGRVAALANQLKPAERASADKAAKGYKAQPINIAANEN